MVLWLYKKMSGFFLELLWNKGVEEHEVRDLLKNTTARKGGRTEEKGRVGKRKKKGKEGSEGGRKKGWKKSTDEASVAKWG